ncbi:MAG TPA: hypothetical protein VHZ98_17640 [Galbitalea sp.]|jgi:hypothetical protein|nr:hypothetical protein [Galbitalea sp.]
MFTVERSRKYAIAAAVLLVLVSGSLTSCSSNVGAKQSAAKECTPASAQVNFGSPTQGKKQAIEAHLISFQDGVMISTPIQVSADTEPTFSYSAHRSLSEISSTSETNWQSSLLSRVRKTRTVPTGFGDGKPVEPSDVTPDASSGKYVVVTEEGLTTVPFAIGCSGEKTLKGNMAALAGAGADTTLTACGTTSGIPPEILALMGPACTQA